MSSIFKKLSVLFCCLFGLVSLNSVVLAKPGDYLVYFLGKDENSLRCDKCGSYFRNVARMASCTYYCKLCSGGSIINNTDCGTCHYYKEGCCNEHNSCYNLFVKYGPFCFINYENGGDVDTVFENAKENKKLYCIGCVLGNINDNWCGKVFSNIDDDNFANSFQLKTIRYNVSNAIKNRKDKPFPEHYCPGHKLEAEKMFGPKDKSTSNPKDKSMLDPKDKSMLDPKGKSMLDPKFINPKYKK